jgi:alpha-L-fucosidase
MSFTPSYEERLKWFHEARFGIFIHWGLYSLLGRGEWAMYRERIPVDEYSQLANEFTRRSSMPMRGRN